MLLSMAALTSNKITANGTYDVATPPGRYALGIGGTAFGSGSLAISWLDAAGNATAYDDSPLTANGGLEIIVPNAAGIRLVLSGATNPVITVSLHVL